MYNKIDNLRVLNPLLNSTYIDYLDYLKRYPLRENPYRIIDHSNKGG